MKYLSRGKIYNFIASGKIQQNIEDAEREFDSAVDMFMVPSYIISPISLRTMLGHFEHIQ